MRDYLVHRALTFAARSFKIDSDSCVTTEQTRDVGATSRRATLELSYLIVKLYIHTDYVVTE